ncbi:MAG TPA: RNA polymerase sigma factor [Ktedonobacterales bacterium]|jgi:RNA polymerase sigma-70 factor (ECF subfamily)|nr:RNA polymerase sigma factor [Ktedonobacterales bacterium]
MTRSAPRFEDVCPALAPTVLRVAAALVGSSQAEDAAQEAMLRAWRSWGELRDVAAARPWLLRITVNICRSWLRSHAGLMSAHETPLPDDDTPQALYEASALSPGGVAWIEHLDLRQALLDLPTDLKLIVTLRYFGGLDSSEIGHALGLPAATVRSRLRRALMLLRDHLKTPGEMPAIRQSGGSDA